MTHYDATPAAGTLSGFFHELRNAAWRQTNVVFALLFKEFKSRMEGETYGSIVWVILDPIQHVMVMAAVWYLLKRTEIDGVHVAIFLAVAMVPYSLIRQSMTAIPSSIRQNRSFFNYQQVKPIDALIARFILYMSLAMIGEVMMFFLIYWFMGDHINFHNLLEITLLFLLTMAMAFGIALTVGTYGFMYDIILKILSFMSRPLLFLSAVFYTMNDLPATARYYLGWNPVVQIISYMRYYALDMKLFPEASIYWPIVFTIIMLFFGFSGYYANRKRLIQTR